MGCTREAFSSQLPASSWRLLRQYLCKEIQRARIPRLPAPEDRLLADVGVAIRLRHVDQQRDPLVLWQLAQREHRLLLYLGIRILVDPFGDRRGGLAPGLLSEPEDGFRPRPGIAVVPGYAQKSV